MRDSFESFHLVLRSRPDVVATWDDSEVTRRWLLLKNLKTSVTGYTAAGSKCPVIVVFRSAKGDYLNRLRHSNVLDSYPPYHHARRTKMSCAKRRLSATFIVTACLFALTNQSMADQTPWIRHAIHAGHRTMTAVAADFSGDGRSDVISNSDGKTRLFVAPDWAEVILDDNPQHQFIHSECFDIDGDGDQDYIGARYDPGLIVWLEQPDRPLEQRWTLRLIDDQVHGIHGLIQGDVDRDGKIDLLATSAQPKEPFPNSLAWFRIPTDVRSAVRWPRYIFAQSDAPGLTHYLGFGDVNGDGRPDAATGAKGGASADPGTGDWFAWWEAPANPQDVWQKHLIADEQPGATNIHPSDVNQDGIVDFVASRGHGRGVVWFEGPNWTLHEIHASIKEPHCLVVVDLDDDGDTDAATCAFGDKTAAWFENDGRGKFSAHVIGHDQEAYDIRAVDLDGDGDLDLLVAGRASDNVVWYENPRVAD